jgi:hypothetical protein
MAVNRKSYGFFGMLNFRGKLRAGIGVAQRRVNPIESLSGFPRRNNA